MAGKGLRGIKSVNGVYKKRGFTKGEPGQSGSERPRIGLSLTHLPALRCLLHLLAHSLTPELVGKRMNRCLKTTWFCPTVLALRAGDLRGIECRRRGQPEMKEPRNPHHKLVMSISWVKQDGDTKAKSDNFPLAFLTVFDPLALPSCLSEQSGMLSD